MKMAPDWRENTPCFFCGVEGVQPFLCPRGRLRTRPTPGSDRAMARRKHRGRAGSGSRKTVKGVVKTSFGVEYGLAAGTTLFLIVDALHFLYFDELNVYFREMLRTPGERTILFILALYLVYSLSLGFLSRLKSGGSTVEGRSHRESDWPKVIHFYPSFGFGIMVILALAEASGWSSDAHHDIPDSWEQAALLGGAAIFFIQLSLGTFDWIEPRYDSRQIRYYIYLVPSAILAEVMLSFSFALWMNSLGADAGTPPIEDPSQVLSFLFLAPLFYLFFAAPRFIFMRLNYTWLTLVSGLFLVLYEVWRFVGENPVV